MKSRFCMSRLLESPWKERRLPPEIGCPVSKIGFADELRGTLIVGNHLMFTTDGGLHWELSTLKPSRISHPVNLEFWDGAGFIACSAGKILRTDNGGQVWEKLHVPVPDGRRPEDSAPLVICISRPGKKASRSIIAANYSKPTIPEEVG